MSILTQHPQAGYSFLPGGATFSGGVVACPGYTMAHAVFHRPPALSNGFTLAGRYLHGLGLSMTAICGVELRIAAPLSLAGFAHLNAEYIHLLDAYNLRLAEVSPMTRTNIALGRDLEASPLLYGFSYVYPRTDTSTAFLSAGTGEIDDEDRIVAEGDQSEAGIHDKTKFVMGELGKTLDALQVPANSGMHVNVYTRLPMTLERLTAMTGIGLHGCRVYPHQPPVIGVEFEMDLRSITAECWLD